MRRIRLVQIAFCIFTRENFFVLIAWRRLRPTLISANTVRAWNSSGCANIVPRI